MLSGYFGGNLRSDPVQVKIDAANSADLVAAPASGYRILVLALTVRLASSQTLKFQSGGSTDLTGAMTLTSLDLQYNPAGWLKCANAEKLNAVLGGAVQISGTLTYALVAA